MSWSEGNDMPAEARLKVNELRITTMKRRIERAQRLVRKYVKPGVSLVDDLIAERGQCAPLPGKS
jgi:hypothetical protein